MRTVRVRHAPESAGKSGSKVDALEALTEAAQTRNQYL